MLQQLDQRLFVIKLVGEIIVKIIVTPAPSQIIDSNVPDLSPLVDGERYGGIFNSGNGTQ